MKVGSCLFYGQCLLILYTQCIPGRLPPLGGRAWNLTDEWYEETGGSRGQTMGRVFMELEIEIIII